MDWWTTLPDFMKFLVVCITFFFICFLVVFLWIRLHYKKHQNTISLGETFVLTFSLSTYSTSFIAIITVNYLEVNINTAAFVTTIASIFISISVGLIIYRVQSLESRKTDTWQKELNGKVSMLIKDDTNPTTRERFPEEALLRQLYLTLNDMDNGDLAKVHLLHAIKMLEAKKHKGEKDK